MPRLQSSDVHDVLPTASQANLGRAAGDSSGLQRVGVLGLRLPVGWHRHKHRVESRGEVRQVESALVSVRLQPHSCGGRSAAEHSQVECCRVHGNPMQALRPLTRRGLALLYFYHDSCASRIATRRTTSA